MEEYWDPKVDGPIPFSYVYFALSQAAYAVFFGLCFGKRKMFIALPISCAVFYLAGKNFTLILATSLNFAALMLLIVSIVILFTRINDVWQENSRKFFTLAAAAFVTVAAGFVGYGTTFAFHLPMAMTTVDGPFGLMPIEVFIDPVNHYFRTLYGIFNHDSWSASYQYVLLFSLLACLMVGTAGFKKMPALSSVLLLFPVSVLTAAFGEPLVRLAAINLGYFAATAFILIGFGMLSGGRR